MTIKHCNTISFITISFITITDYVLIMPAISVSEDVKRELLRFASELQTKFERRVDFDEAIKFLLRGRKGKNPRLLMEACTPGNAEEVLKELYEERRKDEERYSRYFGA